MRIVQALKNARFNAGFELGKMQAGLEPADWMPFDEVGAGTRERRNPGDEQHDKDVAAARYRAVVNAKRISK